SDRYQVRPTRLHVRDHGTRPELPAVAPDLREELVPAERAAGPPGQTVQELELGGGQDDLLSLQPDEVRADIDDQRLVHDALVRSLLLVASQDRLHAQNQLARR